MPWARRFSEANDLLRQEDGRFFFSLLARGVRALRQPQEELPELAGEHSGSALETLRASGNATVLSFYFVLKSLVALVLDKPVDALAAAEQASETLSGVASMTWVPQHRFLLGLALSEGLRGGRVERAAWLERIGRLREELARWAVNSPANYGSKVLLVEAELVDLQGARTAWRSTPTTRRRAPGGRSTRRWRPSGRHAAGAGGASRTSRRSTCSARG